MVEGKIIVIEGVDGSGKATQAKALAENLQKFREVEAFSFPQYESSFFGALVARMLSGEFGGLNDINPYLAAPIYAFDRWEASLRIRRAKEAGKIVVVDRYSPSNFHQAAKFRVPGEREKFIDFFEQMEYDVLRIPREDIVIFLHVPPALAQKFVARKDRRSHLGRRKLDIAESDLDHLQRASAMYKEIAGKRENWLLIDCMVDERMRGERDIQQEILARLRRHKILPE